MHHTNVCIYNIKRLINVSKQIIFGNYLQLKMHCEMISQNIVKPVTNKSLLTGQNGTSIDNALFYNKLGLVILYFFASHIMMIKGSHWLNLTLER